MGYARTKSKPSIIAGTVVGLLCEAPNALCLCPRRPSSLTSELDGLGGYRIQNNQPYGIELSLLASVVLGGASIPRAIRLQKPVPIMLSILATAGMLTFGDAFRRTL
jgi:uncharacterized membrane protein (UPF0136 family)